MAHVSSSRTRIGLTLWVVSYLPFPVIATGLLHAFGVLDSKGATETFLAVTWTIQIIIGFFGLALAGSTAVTLIRKQGIKKLPDNFWHVLRGKNLETLGSPIDVL